MSTEQKDLEQNALATKLNSFWANFKQGKVISYRWMAVLLLLTAGIGVTWYIVHERKKANSLRWLSLEEASTQSALEDVSKNNPGTIQDRLARLQIARYQLSSGIENLAATSQEQRKKGVENIEKARDAFDKLVGEFKDDPVLKPECLLGLAKAEAALVAVPTKEGQLTEFKGTIPRVVELLDQLAAAAPDTPWATDAKKLADEMRDPNSPTAGEFKTVARKLFQFTETPFAPTTKSPFSPIGSGETVPVIPGGP